MLYRITTKKRSKARTYNKLPRSQSRRIIFKYTTFIKKLHYNIINAIKQN
jgi:hypothetical protein